MADAEIKIRVTTDDTDLKKANAATKQFATEIKAAEYAFRQGKISAEGYAKAVADVATRANAANLAFKNTVDLNATLYQSQQRVANGWTSMSKSLKDIDNSIKSKATPSVIEFTRVIQDIPYGIRGVANNIQQLSTNFMYLQKEAKGIIPAIKAMGASLLGPMGIMMGISVITSLAVAFGDKLFPSAKKAGDELDDIAKRLKDIQQLRYELKETSDKQRRGELEIAVSEAQRAFDRATASDKASALKELRKTYGPNVSLAGYEYGEGSPELLALKQAQKELQDFDKRISDEKLRSEKKITEELRDQNKEYAERVKLEAAYQYDYGQAVTRNALLGPRGTQIEKLSSFTTGKGGSLVRGQGIISPMAGGDSSGVGGIGQAKIAFGEWMEYSMDFEDAFTSGIGAMSQTISSEIGGAFASVFGGAKTLMGQFVSAFTQALADLAIKAAAAWTFNSLLPGLGSLIGLGGASKTISNSAMNQRVGGYSSPSFSVVPIVDNQGLAVAVSIGQQQRRKRTF